MFQLDQLDQLSRLESAASMRWGLTAFGNRQRDPDEPVPGKRPHAAPRCGWPVPGDTSSPVRRKRRDRPDHSGRRAPAEMPGDAAGGPTLSRHSNRYARAEPRSESDRRTRDITAAAWGRHLVCNRTDVVRIPPCGNAAPDPFLVKRRSAQAVWIVGARPRPGSAQTLDKLGS